MRPVLVLDPRRSTACVVLAALLPLASAQTTERINLPPGGGEANAFSNTGRPSLAGRYVAFTSQASNLAAVDTNGFRDVFVRDRATGQTVLVSAVAGASGTAANGFSIEPRITDDGRYVAFWSIASNLVAPPAPNGGRVWRRDLLTGVTIPISVRSDGSAVNAQSVFGLSANGRYVAFVSADPNVVPGDTNGKHDVFVHDVQTGTVTRASLAANAAQPDADALRPSLSHDGRWVTFETDASTIWPGAGPPYEQVYAKDLQTGALELVSATPAGAPAPAGAHRASIAALGRFVVFESPSGELWPWPTTPGVNLIYVRDLVLGATWPASVAPGGAPPDNYSYNPSISHDGRLVAFQSTASNLDVGAAPSTYQVFVHDGVQQTVRTVSLGSQGAPGNFNSLWPAISGDGRFVAFESLATTLVPGDGNGVADIFLRDRSGGSPLSYGVGKVNSNSCSPHMQTTGNPSLTAGSGFLLDCVDVLNKKTGLAFYGANGAAAVPFLGGTLYVAPPIRRTPIQFSGGSPVGVDCTGAFTFDFNAHLAGGGDPQISAGVTVCSQYWSRDPADPMQSSLSDAVTFAVGP